MRSAIGLIGWSEGVRMGSYASDVLQRSELKAPADQTQAGTLSDGVLRCHDMESELHSEARHFTAPLRSHSTSEHLAQSATQQACKELRKGEAQRTKSGPHAPLRSPRPLSPWRPKPLRPTAGAGRKPLSTSSSKFSGLLVSHWPGCPSP